MKILRGVSCILDAEQIVALTPLACDVALPWSFRSILGAWDPGDPHIPITTSVITAHIANSEDTFEVARFEKIDGLSPESARPILLDYCADLMDAIRRTSPETVGDIPVPRDDILATLKVQADKDMVEYVRTQREAKQQAEEKKLDDQLFEERVAAVLEERDGKKPSASLGATSVCKVSLSTEKTAPPKRSFWSWRRTQ